MFITSKAGSSNSLIARCTQYVERMSKTGYIRWNDNISCVLDHHANSDFYRAGSLKQQSVAMGRHVAQLGHIILIRTNKYMLLLHIAVNSKYQGYTNDAVHTHKYTSESKTQEFSTAIERWASNSRLWYSRFQYTALPIAVLQYSLTSWSACYRISHSMSVVADFYYTHTTVSAR
jgi:hypothetical protein